MVRRSDVTFADPDKGQERRSHPDARRKNREPTSSTRSFQRSSVGLWKARQTKRGVCDEMIATAHRRRQLGIHEGFDNFAQQGQVTVCEETAEERRHANRTTRCMLCEPAVSAPSRALPKAMALDDIKFWLQRQLECRCGRQAHRKPE